MSRAAHVGQSRWRPRRGPVRTSFILRPRRGAPDVGPAHTLRLEVPGAYYHVINRANHRRDIFGTAGTQLAFESCPFEARAKSGLILHAFVIMGDRGHLALATRTNDPRLPVPFLIQNQPTPPASRPLRPTDSSRIPQSRFSGLGLITEQRIFSTRSADRSNHTRTGRLHSFL